MESWASTAVNSLPNTFSQITGQFPRDVLQLSSHNTQYTLYRNVQHLKTIVVDNIRSLTFILWFYLTTEFIKKSLQ